MARWLASLRPHLAAWPRRQRRGIVASVLASLLAVPIILACAPALLTVNSLPADQVFLAMTITNQYAATPQVRVEAQVRLARNPNNPVVVTSAITLNCDGVTVIAGTVTTGTALVPRQASGGAYTCVYTDERGQQTALAIPVPVGRFAMISPVANQVVPIPGRGPQQANTPASLIDLDIRYAVPTLPVGVSTRDATFQATAVCRPTQNPCGAVPGPIRAATGAYILSDDYARFNNGFEAFSPGLGALEVTLSMGWQAPHTGFNTTSITYRDQQGIPVTWT